LSFENKIFFENKNFFRPTYPIFWGQGTGNRDIFYFGLSIMIHTWQYPAVLKLKAVWKTALEDKKCVFKMPWTQNYLEI
jgi:hypothetical protein